MIRDTLVSWAAPEEDRSDRLGGTHSAHSIIHQNLGPTYASGTISISGTTWYVNHDNTSDALPAGTDSVTIGSTLYLLVDQFGAGVGQYQSVQAAIDAAPGSGGATILIAPGTYTETEAFNGNNGTGGGLYIDKPDLTLQGVEANGSLITTGAAAEASGATIIAAHQTDFGSNHFIGPDAVNTVIQGLHLQAGPETNNKVLEIWGNNATIENNFIDTYIGGTTYSGAIAVYVNGPGSAMSYNPIDHYAIDGNVLNEGVDISNGVGTGGAPPTPDMQIENNEFIGAFDLGSGNGRYDTIVLNGNVNGIGWLTAPVQVPTITGNAIDNNTTPFIMRGSDDSVSNLPTAAEVAAVLAANGNADLTYAYALKPGGALDYATRTDFNGGTIPTYYSFAVTNTIDTLNLALTATPNNVFYGEPPRDYMHSGDTIMLQSGPSPLSSQIMVDGLTVEPSADSAHLTLTMATQYADGSTIPGGVTTLALADYDSVHSLGANVTVDGNDLGDTITANDGNDTLTGGAGNDTFNSGLGSNIINGAGGVNTVAYGAAEAPTTITTNNSGGWTVAKTGGGTDTLSNIQIVHESSGANVLLVGNGGYATIGAAVAAAHPGDTIEISGGTYNENVNVNVNNLTIENAPGQTVVINGTGGYAGAISIASGVTGVTVQSSDSTPSHFVLNSASGQVAALYLVGGNDNTNITGITTVGANGQNSTLTGGSLHNVTFTGNVFDDAGTASQLVYVNGAEDIGPSAQNGNVNFANNSFVGAAAGGLLGMSAPGSVTGNSFTGAGPIQLGLNEDGVTVTGNSFANTSQQYFGSYPGNYNDATLEANNSFGGHEVTIQGPGQDGIYGSITAAMGAAQAGNTIIAPAGTYNEFVDVTQGVTLQGANAGIDPHTGVRGAETIITGGVRVSASNVTLNGLDIQGSYNSVVSDGTDLPNGLLVKGANVTVTDTILDGTHETGDTRPGSTEGSATNFQFTHNLVDGWQEGFYLVNGTTGAVENNYFVNNGNGVLTEDTSVNIDHNTFTGSVGADVALLPFQATVDTASFEFANIFSSGHPRPVSVYLNGPSGQTVDATGAPEAMTFHLEYHTGSATVTGGSGASAISYDETSNPVTIDFFNGAATMGSNVTSFSNIRTAIGSQGATEFIAGASGETFEGQGSSNTVSFADETAGLTINLATGVAAGLHNVPKFTFTDIQNAIGGGGADTFITGAGVAVLTGGTGGDKYYLNNSADVVNNPNNKSTTVYTTVNWTETAGQHITALYANAGATGLTLTANDLGTTLHGGAGNDILVAGSAATAADTLYGGAGANTFVFGSLADSGSTSGHEAKIADFNDAHGDLIDLSQTLGGSQHFAIVSHFDGHADELVIHHQSGNNWLVEGDSTGSGHANFIIEVVSTTAPVAHDFLL